MLAVERESPTPNQTMSAEQNTIAWGCTRTTFTKEEFDYIYDCVESPSRRNLVAAFDMAWYWDGLGQSMKDHPDELLRWIDKIICAIIVHGRCKDLVFSSLFHSPTHTFETIHTIKPCKD